MITADYLTEIEAPTALYKLYAKGGELLYVGVTKNLNGRFAAHATEKDWWPEVRRQEIEWFDTRREAQQLEEKAIFAEKPKHNVVDLIGDRARYDAQKSERDRRAEEERIRAAERAVNAARRLAHPKDADRLAALAGRVQRTVNVIVRDAVTDYLDRHDPDTAEKGDPR